MKLDKSSIIGKRIKLVKYVECGNPDGACIMQGFHTADTGIHIQMNDGFWWHLANQGDDEISFGHGDVDHQKRLPDTEVQIQDATPQWKRFTSLKVRNVITNETDEDEFDADMCEIIFENGMSVLLLIGPEYASGLGFPTDFNYDESSSLYFVYDTNKMDAVKDELMP